MLQIIFFMPTALPTTPNTMNYAVVYFFDILAFSTIYWFVHGRKFYKGPLVEARTDEEPLSLGCIDGEKGQKEAVVIA